MSLIRLTLLMLLAMTVACSHAQYIKPDDASHNSVPVFQNSKVTDSGKYIISYYRTNCKSYFASTEFVPNHFLAIETAVMNPLPLAIKKIKFLTIHGNVSYEFVSRSRTDTSLTQNNFKQHTEKVNVQLLFKERYPLKLAFTSRQSNSPYFKNFIDPNIQFDKISYSKNLKQQLASNLDAHVMERPDLKMTAAALKELTARFNKLKVNLESPASLQKIIEEREKKYHKKENASQLSLWPEMNWGKKAAPVSRNADSLKNTYAADYNAERKKLDSLAKDINTLQKRYDSLKKSAQNEVLAAKKKIYKSVNEKELSKIAKDYGVEAPAKGKFEKHLASIKQFSIGRNTLNYTELTAQNITITGINVEYNPSYYVAFAAGKVDYRFRDFFNRNAKQKGQYLVMGRFGLGNKERKAIIFSLYQGRKNQSEFALPDSISNHINLTGYSLEAIFKKNENTSISAEFAKSTKPVAGGLQNKQEGTLWKLSDNSNMGINIKAQTVIPETHTKVSGFFRKTGEHFQSFSLFSYNTDQTAWMAGVDQSFFKDKLVINGMLRQNDFTNPFTEKTFKTTTVFKSVVINVRIPKYPVIRFGYYPGTQIYVIDKERIRENAYYILNGSAAYSYKFDGLVMNSSFVYNRYINQSTDSGFTSYKGKNYYISHSVFLKKLQMQGGYAFTRQPEMQYHTLEASSDYSIKEYLKVGVGLKYSKISGSLQYWGERLLLSAKLKQFGTFQLQYEKSHLPTFNQSLYPVETGRISWYKYF